MLEAREGERDAGRERRGVHDEPDGLGCHVDLDHLRERLQVARAGGGQGHRERRVELLLLRERLPAQGSHE